MEDGRNKQIDAEILIELCDKIEDETRKYEQARLELEFALRSITIIKKYAPQLSDDIAHDLQTLEDDIQRRLSR